MVSQSIFKINRLVCYNYSKEHFIVYEITSDNKKRDLMFIEIIN